MMLFLVFFFTFNFVCGIKPDSDKEQTVWRVECELGLVTDEDCPVDGGWAGWSPWSNCRGACDGIGYRTRHRDCTNPPPSSEGLPCSGPSQQVETCHLTNCSLEDYRKLTKNNTVRSNALRQLESFPIVLNSCLSSDCTFQNILSALTQDNSWLIKPDALWSSLICVKHNMGCPTLGEWGSWGVWSSCSALCGSGQRWRRRLCDNPPPSSAQLLCQGTPLEKVLCEGDRCALDDLFDKNSTDSLWSEWGNWSVCSDKCGVGVRYRKRHCKEARREQSSENWGTHCRGQQEQIETCDNEQCSLDGGWSGWSVWGPCSKTCGTGKIRRFRSCTRPIPTGNGTQCPGPTMEYSSCNNVPCNVFTHVVTVLNGDSFIKFELENKRFALFHSFIRFLPLSPHGTLIRRGPFLDPHVRVSLHNWHICLDAHGLSRTCALPRLCSPVNLEPAVWHSVLATVTTQGGTIRIDDAQNSIKSAFVCDPELVDENVDISVGGKLHGKIQEVILNFTPLTLLMERNRRNPNDVTPTSASNVVYEQATIEEGYLLLDSNQFVRIPCFDNQNEWKIELTVKPKCDAGTIIFLSNEIDSFIHLMLLNRRLKLKSAIGAIRSESISYLEIMNEQWLDIVLSKKKGLNSIEITVNEAEQMHVTGPKFKRKTDDKKSSDCPSNNLYTFCNSEFYIGAVPLELQRRFKENFSVLSGILASLIVNLKWQDLHKLSIESHSGNKVSSRTASVSKVYYETFLTLSNILNLTCLHAASEKSSPPASWLKLDLKINPEKNKNVKFVNDNKVLKLIATDKGDHRGFYTCRALSNNQPSNLITYGVRGHVLYKPTRADTVTIIALLSSLTLVITTFAWLIIQGIDDLRNGFGFYRDRSLTPEEEADSVCDFIDQNIHLIGSEKLGKIAKMRAKRRCQLIKRANKAAQESECDDYGGNFNFSDDTTLSDEGLEVLPIVEHRKPPASHALYRCELGYISSPVHGSNITNTRAYLTSNSSEGYSPRRLCTNVFEESTFVSQRENMSVRKRKRIKRSRKLRPSLLTIKSSTFNVKKLTTAQVVLRKFRELKTDD